MIQVFLRFLYAVVVLLIMFGLLAGAIYFFKKGIRRRELPKVKEWDLNKYLALVNEGHTAHCAHNMVYGYDCLCFRANAPDANPFRAVWKCSCRREYSVMTEACLDCGDISPWIPEVENA